MRIKGQGHFFTIYFPGFVCFVLYYAKISGTHLQDHWSSGETSSYFNVHMVNNSVQENKHSFEKQHSACILYFPHFV